jgi:ABC-type uncharacterized transport system auxiliary subunit
MTMKKFSLFAILLGFNIALGACSDDDAAPVVKNEIFQLPEKAYVLAEQSRRAIVIRDAETHRNIWSPAIVVELHCLCSCCTAGLVC